MSRGTHSGVNVSVAAAPTIGLNIWCEPRCGGCGPPAGGVPLLEPELFDEPEDFGVGGSGLHQGLQYYKKLSLLVLLQLTLNQIRESAVANMLRWNAVGTFSDVFKPTYRRR